MSRRNGKPPEYVRLPEPAAPGVVDARLLPADATHRVEHPEYKLALNTTHATLIFPGAAPVQIPRPDVPGEPFTPRRACRLVVAGKQLLLDGAQVALDMTDERRKSVLCLLRYLIQQETWISGTEIDREESKLPGQGLAGTKWHTLRRDLPECVANLIEARTGAGQRLRPEAWRN